MSQVLLVCARDANTVPDLSKLEKIAAAVQPENIIPADTVWLGEGGLRAALINPVEAVHVSPNGLALGYLLESPDDWSQPGGALPDGAFALFRWSGEQVELGTDPLASRTIWYAQTPDWFVASTSQRAIIGWLGSFQLNQQAVLWMLSSGTIGPGYSWDERIHLLPADARLTLDRTTWQIHVQEQPVAFNPLPLTPQQHKEHMLDALRDLFSRFHPDPEQWSIMLSGGVDSRGIMLLMENRERYGYITWGRQAALQDPETDGGVARRLAGHFGLRHTYFSTDLPQTEATEVILDRFTRTIEGRVDHLAGYMDGLQIWKDLYEGGVRGVIRGDKGFGLSAVVNEFDVRQLASAIFLSDYGNLVSPQRLGLEGYPEQTFPDHFLRRQDESLDDYRDRLYHTYRIPHVNSSLNAIKAAYVEITSPLIARPLIRLSRELPGELRANKQLWRDVVRELCPEIPHARKYAISRPEEMFKPGPVTDVVIARLTSPAGRALFPEPFLQRLLAQIAPKKGLVPQAGMITKLKRAISNRLPVKWKQRLKKVGAKPDLNPYQLAFRAYMAVTMIELLKQDAHLGE